MKQASSLTFNLEKIAEVVNVLLPIGTLLFGFLGYFYSFYFHFITVALFYLTVVNFYYLKIQKDHTLLTNFGLLSQMRYMIESVGPEFRQYLYMGDTEEKPFSRIDRSEIYRKAKNIDSSAAFGSLLPFDGELKLKHSLFPVDKKELEDFSLTFGEERGINSTYTLKTPIISSAMSYGALSQHAVRAIARGVKKAGGLMNTGEGGYPKYHLKEGCDLVFQMGTAKFGVRDDEGNLDDAKLKEIADKPQIKMVEIKLSQGAKPGKGGLLPKEKITDEISELRNVPKGQDVISPAFHKECSSAEKTVQFIQRVQDVSQLPVGIKFCLGRIEELTTLFTTMKEQNTFPDYIVVDGAEGGTGAAPKSFMDDIGIPIFEALPQVISMLKALKIRDKMKVLSSGKLISPGKQIMALSMGADAIYTARGMMLSLGCIQAMKCNNNTCPVGITSHNPKLYKGLDIENKSERIYNYIHNIIHDHQEIIASMGVKNYNELSMVNVYQPDSEAN